MKVSTASPGVDLFPSEKPFSAFVTAAAASTSELMQIFSLKFSFHFFIVGSEPSTDWEGKAEKETDESFLPFRLIYLRRRYRDREIFEFPINA
jgi:hypothetical protein